MTAYCYRSEPIVFQCTSLDDEYKRYENKYYNFEQNYGAKPNKFKVGDEVRFYWYGRMKSGKVSHIRGYKLYNADVDGIIYRDIIEEDIHLIKGKDNNMTNVSVYVDCVGATNYGTEKSFFVAGPKFNTGTKIKFHNGNLNWKQGVIYSLNKKVTISKTGDEKEFKADNLQWFYTIVESGNLKTWNGVKQDYIKIDDTPDYNKYFDFLDKQGVKLDRTRYTWKSFSQVDWYWIPNYRAEPPSVEYNAILCDKLTGKEVKFNGRQVGTDKLSSVS